MQQLGGMLLLRCGPVLERVRGHVLEPVLPVSVPVLVPVLVLVLGAVLHRDHKQELGAAGFVVRGVDVVVPIGAVGFVVLIGAVGFEVPNWAVGFVEPSGWGLGVVGRGWGPGFGVPQRYHIGCHLPGAGGIEQTSSGCEPKRPVLDVVR